MKQEVREVKVKEVKEVKEAKEDTVAGLRAAGAYLHTISSEMSYS